MLQDQIDFFNKDINQAIEDNEYVKLKFYLSKYANKSEDYYYYLAGLASEHRANKCLDVLLEADIIKNSDKLANVLNYFLKTSLTTVDFVEDVLYILNKFDNLPIRDIHLNTLYYMLFHEEDHEDAQIYNKGIAPMLFGDLPPVSYSMMLKQFEVFYPADDDIVIPTQATKLVDHLISISRDILNKPDLNDAFQDLMEF